MSNVLTLPLKRIYFEQIRDGSKAEEFRLVTPYWRKRLEGRSYEGIRLTLGYPKASDAEKILIRPWKGFRTTFIRHPHFGQDAVEVFAIDVRDPKGGRGRLTTYVVEPIPESERTRCTKCGGRGTIETVEDLHRSSGIIPCPQSGCRDGIIRSRRVETFHD